MVNDFSSTIFVTLFSTTSMRCRNGHEKTNGTFMERWTFENCIRHFVRSCTSCVLWHPNVMTSEWIPMDVCWCWLAVAQITFFCLRLSCVSLMKIRVFQSKLLGLFQWGRWWWVKLNGFIVSHVHRLHLRCNVSGVVETFVLGASYNDLTLLHIVSHAVTLPCRDYETRIVLMMFGHWWLVGIHTHKSAFASFIGSGTLTVIALVLKMPIILLRQDENLRWRWDDDNAMRWSTMQNWKMESATLTHVSSK